MRSLLDINVLIALFDPDHAFHDRAHAWWSENGKHGWASCPLTENGAIRILSHPSYSRKIQFTPAELIEGFREFSQRTDHEFWGDSISLLDQGIFDSGHIHNSRQLTDLYLQALAVFHHGRLVTFDEGIVLSTVLDAKAGNLHIL